MTAKPSIDPAEFLHEHLSQASPDLLRELMQGFINTLLSADADSVCGAAYGARDPDRTNRRNGYRHRDLDTRVGTLDVAVPKLREGSYFPEWLLERRRRAEAALTSVVATCYLLGVSTRRMDRLVQSLGITGLSKSQVSVMARDLDELVRDFRERPLDAGPYTFVAADALTMKVREGGRVIKIAVMVATGVNADGYREILGVATSTSESGAGWNSFFKDLVARGLNGVALVTSDAHTGLVEAIGANLPGAILATLPHPLHRNLMARVSQARLGRGQGDAAQRLRPDRRRGRARPVRQAARPRPRSARGPRPPRRRPRRHPRLHRVPAKRSGARSGPTTPTNASTARSAAAPTSSGSSPTGPRSSASSAPSWPSRTTNGPTAAATSASTSSPRADSS